MTAPAPRAEQGTLDRNCLTYWFPRIEAAGLPVPKTLMLDMSQDVGRGMFNAFDGKPIGAVAEEWIATGLKPAVEFIGLPCFLRTGQTSNKHDWQRSCYVTDSPKLLSHVLSLIEFSECCDFMGIPWNKWAVREMLPTIPQMVADRYGNMPVCREFRFFVRDGVVECVHPYWPKEALERGLREKPHDFDWRYTCLSYMPGVYTEELHDLASRAGAAVGGFWSVDILETTQGWYVTDMAIGERSWHWPECPHLEATA